MTGTTTPPPDPCELARQQGATLAQYWECTKKVLGQIADQINPGGEVLMPTFEQRANAVDPKTRTPETLALLLAKSAQDVGHYADAVLISYALMTKLLQTQRKNRTILSDALKIHLESLPRLGDRRDKTLSAMDKSETDFFTPLQQFITKK